MDSVYLLWYVKAPDSDDEDELLVGVCDSEKKAQNAIERLKDKPGFVTAPEGFQIHRYEVNQDHWTDGFVATN